MQPGIVGLRGALIAAWEADLQAGRRDTLEVGRGREALDVVERDDVLLEGRVAEDEVLA